MQTMTEPLVYLSRNHHNGDFFKRWGLPDMGYYTLRVYKHTVTLSYTTDDGRTYTDSTIPLVEFAESGLGDFFENGQHIRTLSTKTPDFDKLFAYERSVNEYDIYRARKVDGCYRITLRGTYRLLSEIFDTKGDAVAYCKL